MKYKLKFKKNPKEKYWETNYFESFYYLSIFLELLMQNTIDSKISFIIIKQSAGVGK